MLMDTPEHNDLFQSVLYDYYIIDYCIIDYYCAIITVIYR